jgi:DNA-binding GntR family transcriptional regulator
MDGDSTKIDSVYFALKDLVTHYDLLSDPNLCVLPGEHLHIEELAHRVKASATPVRQALERLQGEGLIESIPKRGFFTKTPDASALQDHYAFAFLILDYSLTRAAHASILNGFGPGAQAVRAHDDLSRCVRYQALVMEEVYAVIAGLSRNDHVQRGIRNFNDCSRYTRCLYLIESPDPVARVREVVALVDLLREREIAAARASLEKQMTETIKRLPDLLRTARSRWAQPPAAAM